MMKLLMTLLIPQAWKFLIHENCLARYVMSPSWRWAASPACWGARPCARARLLQNQTRELETSPRASSWTDTLFPPPSSARCSAGASSPPSQEWRTWAPPRRSCRGRPPWLSPRTGTAPCRRGPRGESVGERQMPGSPSCNESHSVKKNYNQNLSNLGSFQLSQNACKF